MKHSLLTLAAIACVAHEVNRSYCAAQGDRSQAPWAGAPEWQKQSAIAGVTMHLGNPDATPEDSHASWLAQKLADGWKYGPVKDAEKKEHPCCVPYAELPPEQKAKDYIFRGVVHALSGLSLEDLTKAGKAGAPEPVLGEAVTYIGRREHFIDRSYGSNLTFSPGQTRMVPPDLARRLLRHVDLFKAAEEDVAEAADTQVATDDTSAILAKSKEEKAAHDKEQNQIQDLRDQVASMDKNALDLFARTNYRQELDKRLGLGKLREQVTGFIDQFGAL